MFEAVKGLFGRKVRLPDPTAARVERVRIINPYHAVAIKPGPACCLTAKAMTGVRFLSREAPRLPLPQCDAARCDCKYVHFDDRRSYERRASDMGPGKGGKPFTGPDRRRAQHDRRAEG